MFSIPSQLPEGLQVRVESWWGIGGQAERSHAIRSEFDPEITDRHQVLGSFFVAVKKLRLSSDMSLDVVKRRFVREMQVWSRLDHQNIVKFLGFHINVEIGDAWLISHWCTNGSLDDMLKDSSLGRLGNLTRGVTLEDTACGLMYLHGWDSPVVHGNIKPSNVLITPQGRAQLCDLGLSRIIRSKGPSPYTSAQFKGSLRWCSPEVTRESDVWSWGVLADQISTNEVPLLEEPDDVFIARVQKGDLDVTLGPLMAHQSIIAIIIQQCWYLNPSERRPIAETYEELHSKQSGHLSRKVERLGKYLQIGFAAWIVFLGLACWEAGVMALYTWRAWMKSWLTTSATVPLIFLVFVTIAGSLARRQEAIKNTNVAALALVRGDLWPYLVH